MHTTYTTKRDAIEREILPALGEYADDYDIDKLADKVLAWVDVIDTAGNVRLDLSGFQLAVEAGEFWTAAQEAEK